MMGRFFCSHFSVRAKATSGCFRCIGILQTDRYRAQKVQDDNHVQKGVGTTETFAFFLCQNQVSKREIQKINTYCLPVPSSATSFDVPDPAAVGDPVRKRKKRKSIYLK